MAPNQITGCEIPPGVPGEPADFQAPRMSPATSSTPFPSFTLVNTVGPLPRIFSESRAITSSEAPTCGARSICRAEEREVSPNIKRT